MENLDIKQEGDTPGVLFDVTKKNFVLEGRSLPADAVGFYEPIRDFVAAFFASGSDPDAVFEMKLTYFNSATSKQLHFLVLDFVKHKGCVKWCYPDEDEDLLEAGEDFIDVVKSESKKHGFCFDESKFKLIPVFD